MRYEIFLYTKTSSDDWNFHVIPSSISSDEKNKIRNLIVNGLYAAFPSVSKEDFEKNYSSYNYSYFYSLGKNFLFISATPAPKTDNRGRPFWYFIGAVISAHNNSIDELKRSLHALFTSSTLITNAEEYYNYNESAPMITPLSKEFTIDSSINFVKQQSEGKELEGLLNCIEYNDTNRIISDREKIIDYLLNPLIPLFYFNNGPLDKGYFSQGQDFLHGEIISTVEKQIDQSGHLPLNNYETVSDMKEEKRSPLVNLIAATLSYPLGVYDLLRSKTKRGGIDKKV